MGIARTERTRRQRGLGVLAAAVLGLGILAAACGPVDQTPAPPGCPANPPDPLTQTILNRTNGDRSGQGLPALFWNARLACLADEWSRYMRDTGQFRHRDLNVTIKSPGFEDYAGLGENILVGPSGMDGNAMHTSWMNSPAHQANIMGNYDTIGVGYARGSDGRLWATENFGRHF
jgi:uncharacterized protein YkwD